MNNNKGFTMIELLAVIAIMGILIGISMQAYTMYIDRSIKNAKKMFNQSVISAAEDYVMDNPTAREVTIKRLIDEGYLEGITNDKLTKGKSYKGRVEIEKASKSGELDTYTYTFYMCFAGDKYVYKEDPEYEEKLKKNPDKPPELMIEVKETFENSKCG